MTNHQGVQQAPAVLPRLISAVKILLLLNPLLLILSGASFVLLLDLLLLNCVLPVLFVKPLLILLLRGIVSLDDRRGRRRRLRLRDVGQFPGAGCATGT